MNIGIAGAGVLGRLLAWRLAGEGHRVTVFDPAADAQARGAAAWSAAGMLSPTAEIECGDYRVERLGWRSVELWSDIAASLAQPVDFQRCGSLLLAYGSDLGVARRLVDLLQSKAESPPVPVSPAELRTLEPAVQGPTHAWRLNGECLLNPIKAMTALTEEATRRGAQWRWGRTVREVGPGTLDGERFERVFDVRGVGARPDLPVRGVRGEVMWLHAPGVVLNRPLRLLHPRLRVYLVPRPDDIVFVGASEVESEDRSPISVRTLLGLLSAAHGVIPELAEARLVHSEANLRPALPDNLPLVDKQPGLVRINGLFRHGWLIAPALVEEALQ